MDLFIEVSTMVLVVLIRIRPRLRMVDLASNLVSVPYHIEVVVNVLLVLIGISDLSKLFISFVVLLIGTPFMVLKERLRSIILL